MEELNWVSGVNSGIPFLFCPAEIAPLWEAIDPPKDGRVVQARFRFGDERGPATDYDRACDLAKDYVQLIAIGTGEALLLGEEIPFATWIDASKFTGGYILIPEFWSEDEPDYIAFVEGIADEAFSQSELQITATGSGFMLFPATDQVHDEDTSMLEVNCPAGRYAVSLAFYANDNTEIRVIKVERVE